jgi:hypothetical protein
VLPGETEKTGIALIAAPYSVTINGTVNATINGQRPGSVAVIAYSSPYNGVQQGAGYTQDSNTWTMRALASGEKMTLYFMVSASPAGGSNSLQAWSPVSLVINPGERTKTVDLGDMVMTPSEYGYVTINDIAAVQKELDDAYVSVFSYGMSHADIYHYTNIYVGSVPNGFTFIWLVDGTIAPVTGSSVYFYARDYAPGLHYVTLVGIKNGLMATREFSFTVTD